VVGSPIGKRDDLQKVIKQGDWNDYRIVAKGPVLQHFINGRLMSEVVDDQVGKRAAEGILAIQLHDGPPMKVEVKDIRLDRAIGNGQAALKWAAPMGNSGSPITDYAVQYSSNGGTSWTSFAHSASTSTTATVTGLTNGTSYVFRVAAVNAAGTGSWSTKSSPITPRTVSSPPTNVIGTPTDRQVALRWIAPSSNGGSPITDYAVQYSSNGGGSWTTYAHPASKSTTATVTGLTNGTSYMFRVAAVNAAGTGNYSASTARVTPLAASPGRPTVVAGNGYVDLRWTAPALPSTPPITDYTIRYSADNGVTWSLYSHTATTATSSRLALTNGITYTFQVAPVVSGGMGNSSVSSLPVTPYSPTAIPSSPSGVAGVKTGTGVTLSWNSVTGNAGGPVSDYVVQYRINLPDTRWLTYMDPVTSATSANLVIRSGYSYVFRIAAKNLAGVGAYSTQSSPVSA